MLVRMFLDHMTTCLIVKEACAHDAGIESQMDQRDILPKS